MVPKDTRLFLARMMADMGINTRQNHIHLSHPWPQTSGAGSQEENSHKRSRKPNATNVYLYEQEDEMREENS